MNIPNMPKNVKKILSALNSHGYEGYIVGGCVRDSIMGIEPHDWDITTSATPQEVKTVFGYTIDTGIKHGTVTVVMDKENYEITTYRVDGDYRDCRHPEAVSFTRELHEDLLRRDFTMNAIAYCEKEGYVDIFGGIEDIYAQIIRGVGAPCERFQEDALRMLRAVRFSAQLDFEIEKDTLSALSENAQLIENISAERIREELTKTLLGEYPQRLPVLWESGLLGFISKDICEKVSQNGDKLIKQLKALPKETVIVYAAFLQYADFTQALKIIKSLKFDTKTKTLLETVLKNINGDIKTEQIFMRKHASKVGVEPLKVILLLKKAQDCHFAEKALAMLEDIVEKNQCITIKQLEISGDDLFEMGVEKGKTMGKMLNDLLNIVMEKPELNNKEALKKAAAEIFL